MIARGVLLRAETSRCRTFPVWRSLHLDESGCSNDAGTQSIFHDDDGHDVNGSTVYREKPAFSFHPLRFSIPNAWHPLCARSEPQHRLLARDCDVELGREHPLQVADQSITTSRFSSHTTILTTTTTMTTTTTTTTMTTMTFDFRAFPPDLHKHPR